MPSPRRRAKARTTIAMTPEEELEARVSGNLPPELAAIDAANERMHLAFVRQAVFVANRSTDPYFTDEGAAVQWAEAVSLIERARLLRRAA
jgi:hypothetical protein